MKVYKRLVALTFAAAAAIGSAAAEDLTQGAIHAKDGGAAPDPAQFGRALFALHCSHCHGVDMVTAGTVTYDLREFPRDAKERFFESVTNGKSGRMPPWGDLLTQEEIGEIWAYVRTGGKP